MKPNKFIRILCEGKVTEPNYFRGLLKEYGHTGAQITKPKDHSPVGVVNAAKEEYKKALKAKIPAKDIHVWAVFDRDGHANLKQAIKNALDSNINVGYSSVCFEYFILLHFEKCTRPFTNCDEIIKYLRDNYSQDYSKRNNHFNILKAKFQDTVDNSYWLLQKHWKNEEKEGVLIADINPYSDVSELLKFLTGLKETNKNKK